MLHHPPSDSKIEIDSSSKEQKIVIPHVKPRTIRFFSIPFLVLWFAGWSIGFAAVCGQFLEGKGSVFLGVWLVVWALAGIMASSFLFQWIRRPLPEVLSLSKSGLSFDSGTPPNTSLFYELSRGGGWKAIFPRRLNLEFSAEELSTVALRETGFGNRLTIDKGSDRFEIARSATEVDRDWLFEYIQASHS